MLLGLKRHAFRIVLLKPSLRGILIGEDLDVLRITRLHLVLT